MSSLYAFYRLVGYYKRKKGKIISSQSAIPKIRFHNDRNQWSCWQSKGESRLQTQLHYKSIFQKWKPLPKIIFHKFNTYKIACEAGSSSYYSINNSSAGKEMQMEEAPNILSEK